MAAQGYIYSLCIHGEPPKKMNVIRDILVGPEAPQDVLAYVQDPHVHIISATVTEKGYHLRPDGSLDLNSDPIRSEIEAREPASLIGYLAFGLAKRTTPVTILSCDNRMGNGDALKRAVAEFAVAADIHIPWQIVSFPNAMVDRIVPKTDDELRRATGDVLAVPTEPFTEWVIEEKFKGPRPNWRGVTFVDDVLPHEKRKLRMLNGAHSYLAYAGVLAGYEFVHQAVSDTNLRQSAIALMEEARETLPLSIQADARIYLDNLIARFENPNLHHALRQIAMDGSEKMQYRIVDTIRDRDTMGLSSPALRAAIDAWVQFCQAETNASRSLEDPRAVDIANAKSSHDLLSIIGAQDLV